MFKQYRVPVGNGSLILLQIAKLEPELQGGWQSTPRGIRWNLWHWVKVQEV